MVETCRLKNGDSTKANSHSLARSVADACPIGDPKGKPNIPLLGPTSCRRRPKRQLARDNQKLQTRTLRPSFFGNSAMLVEALGSFASQASLRQFHACFLFFTGAFVDPSGTLCQAFDPRKLKPGPSFRYLSESGIQNATNSFRTPMTPLKKDLPKSKSQLTHVSFCMALDVQRDVELWNSSGTQPKPPTPPPPPALPNHPNPTQHPQKNKCKQTTPKTTQNTHAHIKKTQLTSLRDTGPGFDVPPPSPDCAPPCPRLAWAIDLCLEPLAIERVPQVVSRES